MVKYFCKEINCNKEVKNLNSRCKKHAYKIHPETCKCCSCKSKRGETKGKNNHLKNCVCNFCKVSRGEMTGKKHHNYKDGLSNKNGICIDCKNKTSSLRYKRCIKCSNILENNSMFNVHRFGKSNPNYIDGRSLENYPSEYDEQLRNKIKKRDNYECKGKNCSITQEEHYIIYGRDIEIHHIDYNKQNCNENNLITLCKQCNLRANHNREFWLKYFKNVIKEVFYNVN